MGFSSVRAAATVLILSGMLAAAAPPAAATFHCEVWTVRSGDGPIGARVHVAGRDYADDSGSGSVSRVTVGQAVQWYVNPGPADGCHTVTLGAANGGIDFVIASPWLSGVNQCSTTCQNGMAPGSIGTATYTVTFTVPGIFPYTCKIHGTTGQNGVVVVTA